MQLRYDLDVRALYIVVTVGAVARTVEAGNAAVDLDDAGNVVGIEVISIDQPWPLAGILRDYLLSEGDKAQLRAYFDLDESDGLVIPEPPQRADLVSA